MNTTLGIGVHPGPGFEQWKRYALSTPAFRAGAIIARGTPHLSEAEIAAYDAPFPDPRYQAGARQVHRQAISRAWLDQHLTA